MELVKQNIEFIAEDYNKMVDIINLLGRKCYNSEVPDSREEKEEFIKRLIKMNHTSVIEHRIISVIFTTSRSVANELVRHRLGNYSQASTRYINYKKHGVKFILPEFSTLSPGHYSLQDSGYILNDKFYPWNTLRFEDAAYLSHLWDQAEFYRNNIIDGLKPEEAKEFLPLCTRTEIGTTFNIRQWRHVIQQRTSKQAYKPFRIMITELKERFKANYPCFFEDI